MCQHKAAHFAVECEHRHAVAHGQHQHGGGPVDGVAGGYLRRAGLQEMQFGHRVHAFRQLAAERAQTEERERMANLALQKQRERDAGERTRAEVARLALLAELAKPVAMLGSGLDQKWLRQDAKGDLLVRGVKLPFDVRINAPTDDVPSACRGYSGAWGRARWDGERSAEIWIESVTADCRIKAVYGRGGDSVDGDDPTFVRAEGSFEGGKVQLRVSPTASVTIAPDGDGGLAATWQSNSKRVSLTFQRISSDPKANAEYVSLEEMDYGTRPTGSIWSTNFSRALPMEVPGVRTLSTAQLWQMLSETKDLQLVSAHEGQSRPLIERSVWLPDLGKPMSYRAVNGATVRIGAKELDDLRTSLAQLTGGDKTKPIVVYDRSVTWGWFGYHGAIRLREMGYANVYWFRGGTDAWHDAGLPLRKTGS